MKVLFSVLIHIYVGSNFSFYEISVVRKISSVFQFKECAVRSEAQKAMIEVKGACG
jgi:hypothetical protein